MADRITLEQALTDEPLWMAVGILEPDRKIEVEATYRELIAIRKLWDRYHPDHKAEYGGDDNDTK